MTNPLVSVVIPVYKVEKYLRDCVLSAVNQTYENIEIILVNDGSPDRCPEICDQLASEFINVQVIHKVNGGSSEARNFGIEKANGQYLLFLDSDDTLVVGTIENLINKAIKYNVDLVIPDRYNQIDESTRKCRVRYHFDRSCHIVDPYRFAQDVIIGKGRAWRAHSVLYKASIVKKNDLKFPVGYIGEDIVFNLSYLAKCKTLTFYSKPTVNYLKRANSITTSFQAELDKVFMFIDGQVENFLRETNQLSDGDSKRKQLLCRNSIVFLTSLFSKKCNWDNNYRLLKADRFLLNRRVLEAFRIKHFDIYFQNIAIVIYFKIMFHLIRIRKKNLAYRLAEIVGNIA